MKQLLTSLLACVALVGDAAVSFVGLSHEALRYETAANTGLEAVYVLDTTAGVSGVWESKSNSIKCYRFSQMGGAYAEEIATTKNGNTFTFGLSAGDMGYIVEDGGSRTYFWVTDYSSHALVLGSLHLSSEQDCSSIALDFGGSAEEIAYYTINGRRMTLSRELTLSYTTLIFDDENFIYRQQNSEETLDAVNARIYVPSPLCDTYYTLTGDRFLRAWGEEQSIQTENCPAAMVEARTRATQSMRETDNEQSSEATGLGGSAPCEIEFEASVSDAVVFRQWQISRSPEFDILENSYSELQFSYTFTEQGTSYVRFTADNAAGTCLFESETYEVFVGESKLDIPNAFSPQGSPGVNDEWKVSYKSLISYECHIFNRWGKELFSSTDPSVGWDGRSGGKYVGAGVYFYVIKARGADGIKYERAGDINIINYSDNGTQTTTEQ